MTSGLASERWAGTSPGLSILSWWGGFFAGPIVGAAVWATAKDDALTRSHGGAAAIVWVAGLALWIPLNAWVFLVSQNWSVLLVALPFVVVPTLFFCCLGTVQAMRGHTIFGRQP
jgi:hypothetical protein